MRTACFLIVCCLAACKDTPKASPAASPPAQHDVASPPRAAEAVEPAEPEAAPAGAAVANAADYEAQATALTDKLLAMFAADGTDCDKLAADLTAFAAQNHAQFARLKAFEQAHPDAEQAFDTKMQAREEEIDGKLGPTIEACKNHEGLAAAIDKLPMK